MSSSSDLVSFVESLLGGSVSDSVLLMITTSFAVIVGLLVLSWKRLWDRSKELKPVVIPKSLAVKDEEDEAEAEAFFYGTQTGTAEGFAKASYFEVQTIASSFPLRSRVQKWRMSWKGQNVKQRTRKSLPYSLMIALLNLMPMKLLDMKSRVPKQA